MDSSGKSLRSISSVGGTITDECYILNMYLLKGTVTVFLELADNFFQIIQNQMGTSPY